MSKVALAVAVLIVVAVAVVFVWPHRQESIRATVCVREALAVDRGGFGR
jgi:hypothetical protein